MKKQIAIIPHYFLSILVALFLLFPVLAFADDTSLDDALQEEFIQDQGAQSADKKAPAPEIKAKAATSSSQRMEGKNEDYLPPITTGPVSLDVSRTHGTVNKSIPIEVPRGTNGLTPRISLNYNSSARNGIAGVGWNLNNDSIQRSTRKGTCYTCKDFVYNGEDLVPVDVDANRIGTYRPEKEQVFPLIRLTSENQWIVTLKDGLL